MLETAGKLECDAPAKRWRQLFERLAHAEVLALAELYDLSSARLYGLALWRTGNREDADDVVQEVFVKLGEQRQRLRRIRDPLSWLLTVTHRTAIDLVRRRTVRHAATLEDFDLIDSGPRGLSLQRGAGR